MTREPFAHHDPAIMTPDLSAALVVHRATPPLSLPELCARAKLPGPARRAVEHARGCSICGVGSLCPAGERLASKIRPSRRRRPR
jgi:hypothetical protein